MKNTKILLQYYNIIIYIIISDCNIIYNKSICRILYYKNYNNIWKLKINIPEETTKSGYLL